jgi:hypothetical protein
LQKHLASDDGEVVDEGDFSSKGSVNSLLVFKTRLSTDFFLSPSR